MTDTPSEAMKRKIRERKAGQASKSQQKRVSTQKKSKKKKFK